VPFALDAQMLDCEFLTLFERMKQFFRYRHSALMSVQLQFGNSRLQVGDTIRAFPYMPLRAREVVFAVGHIERYLGWPARGNSRVSWRLHIDIAGANGASAVRAKFEAGH